MITVDDAYVLCRKTAHKHGANFSVGFRFLPRLKRRAVYAAYAFCRWADDIADEDDDLRLRGCAEIENGADAHLSFRASARNLGGPGRAT